MDILTSSAWADACAGMTVESRDAVHVDEILIHDYADLMVFRSDSPWMQVAGSLPQVLADVLTIAKDGTLDVLIDAQAKALSSSKTSHMAITRSNQQASPDRVLVGIGLPGTPNIRIAQGGAGDVFLAGVDQDVLVLKIQGTGNVQAHGKVGRLEATIEGAGNVDAKNLKANSVDLNVLGSGNIDAYASHEAAAEISGAGSILVRGQPQKRNHLALSTGKIVFAED